MSGATTRNKRRKKPQRRWTEPPEHGAVWSRVAWIACAAAWAFLVASMLSFDAADPPAHVVSPANASVANWCGPMGAWVAAWVVTTLGIGSWLLLAGGGLALGLAAAGRTPSQFPIRAVGLLMLALAVSGFHALLWPEVSAMPEGGGGTLAIAGVHELRARFSVLGSALWLALLGMVGATVAFDWLVVTVPMAVWHALAPRAASAGAAAGAKAKGAATGWAETRAEKRRERLVRANDIDDDTTLERATARMRASEVVGSMDESGDTPAVRTRKVRPAPAEAPEDDTEVLDEDEDAEWEYDEADEAEAYEDDEEDADEPDGAPQVYTSEQLEEKIAGLPVKFASQSRRAATEDDLRDWQSEDRLEGYRFPPLDLLEDPEESFSDRQEQYVREQARALEEALRVYKIDGEVVGIESGPVITLFEVRLAPGTKVNALSAVSSDVARALKAVNIRVVPNMVGRDTVGVEVPNREKEKVRLKELMSVGGAAERMRLPMFLGKDASGEPLIEDLASMPHVLIAGTTGSGKSVCLNTIIMSFLYTKKPNELKLVLIDPKMVEMAMFRDIPHLMCPVVTEMSKAAAILEWAVQKMDERYELLAEAGVRDIASYNELEWEELKERFDPKSEAEEARIPRKLPFIVFMIDELADLMMTHKEVEGAIVRIAQKARAVGMHLVVATQRPQANVVTGLIKSNLPGRVAFKVASGMDSRIVLDQKGGELLLGQGDMLVLSPRSHKLERSQGTLVEDREARRVVRFLKEVAAPSFDRQLVQLRSPDAGEDAEASGLQNALDDPLFAKAVEVVLDTKRGSVSLLQRRLAIGYTRASRLIDLMGECGVIGAYKGTVAREVTITPEQWEQMKARLLAEKEAQGDLFPTESDEDADEAPAPARTEATNETRTAVEAIDETEDEPAPFEASAADDEGDEADEAEVDGALDDEEDEYEDEDADETAEVQAAGDDSGEEEDDEGEWEYEYVDEDGNPIDPEDLDEYEDSDDAEDDDEEEWDEEEDDAEDDEPDVSVPPFDPTRARKGA